MRLNARQWCPIHRSCFCSCHRQAKVAKNRTSKWERVASGISRIRDQWADHPDGYRYRLSPARKREVLLAKLAEKNECGICHKPFENLSGIVPDHINPKGMAGARADDREENLQPVHVECNNLKGSQRNFGGLSLLNAGERK